MKYGKYDLRDIQLRTGDIGITITEKNRKIFEYLRKSPDGEKRLYLSGKGNLLIEPFPPVFLPKKITSFILLDFESDIVLEPSGTSAFYTSFPVETGVMVSGKNDIELLDVFSNEKPKYTLYGSVEQGIICRYFKTGVGFEPEENSGKAVALITIKNRYREWVNVSRVVIDCSSLSLFYKEEKIRSGNINMEIQNRDVAIIRTSEKAPEKNMARAVSLKQLEARILAPKKITDGRKYTMWWGY